MTKKQQIEFDEKINRLVEFYNALSDDEKMSLMIEKIDAVHDTYVSLQTDITLLKETLNIFMKKFDEDMDVTDKNVATVKEDVIKKFEKSLLGIMENDIVGITKKLKRLEADAEEDINAIVNYATAKVDKQARNVRAFKIEKMKFNITGAILILVGVGLGYMGLDTYANIKESKKYLEGIVENQHINHENILYLQQVSDKRFADTVKAYKSIIKER